MGEIEARLIEKLSFQFSSETVPTISLPNIIREGCQEDAYDLVNRSNNAGSGGNDSPDVAGAGSDSNGDSGPELKSGNKQQYVENPKVLSLISSLTALMLHIKQLAHGER